MYVPAEILPHFSIGETISSVANIAMVLQLYMLIPLCVLANSGNIAGLDRTDTCFNLNHTIFLTLLLFVICPS